MKLRESEQRYRELYETSRDGIVMLNLEGQIVHFNNSFQQMIGYSVNEISAATLQELTPPEWHEMEQVILKEEVMKRGFSVLYEKEYLRKDGTRIPVEIRTYLSKHYDGRAIGYWAYIRDITERKKSEEALRNSEMLYQSLVGKLTAVYF